MLDIKLIEQGKFENKLQLFNPVEVLNFIIAMFRPQADMVQTEIVYESVASEAMDEAFDHDHDKFMMPHSPLPAILYGDQLRLR